MFSSSASFYACINVSVIVCSYYATSMPGLHFHDLYFFKDKTVYSEGLGSIWRQTKEDLLNSVRE